MSENKEDAIKSATEYIQKTAIVSGEVSFRVRRPRLTEIFLG